LRGIQAGDKILIFYYSMERVNSKKTSHYKGISNGRCKSDLTSNRLCPFGKGHQGLLKPSHQLLLVVADEVDDL
jgi:hypothetical protein